MPYQSLAKLFYADTSPDRYAANESLAQKRLEAESTFRTGMITPNGELFLAVPRELSLLNEQVLRYERRISQNLRTLPPVARAALVRGLVVDEVVSTNELEGVHSTRRQINDILQADIASDSPRMDRRFRELVRLYLNLSDEDKIFPATPQDIRSIYDRVMAGEKLGKNAPDGKLFRKDGVDVIGSGGKVLHQGLYPESKIQEGIELMLALMDSDEMPATYSAIVGHYIFEYIHPFYDGNGRTGRYLLALYLSRPLSLLTSLSLSRVIAENRSAYYKSFKDAEHKLNHGELTLFVMSILRDVQIAQEELGLALHEKNQQLTEAISLLDKIQKEENLSSKQAEIMFSLVQLKLFAAFDDATLQEIAEHLTVGTQQARKYLKRLEKKDLVCAINSRPLRFVLSDRAYELFGLEE